MSHLSEVFDDIYRNDRWGNGSGPGSDRRSAEKVISDVNDCLADSYSKSMLDIGCGDGQLARWFRPAVYLGVDVSGEALKAFRRNTIAGESLVQMNAADAVWHFDFVLIKDVLQHLPLEECQRLLRSVRHCGKVWVINDCPSKTTLSDCKAGDYRPIDPRVFVPEFRVRGQYLVARFHKTLWEWAPSEGEAPTER